MTDVVRRDKGAFVETVTTLNDFWEHDQSTKSPLLVGCQTYYCNNVQRGCFYVPKEELNVSEKSCLFLPFITFHLKGTMKRNYEISDKSGYLTCIKRSAVVHLLVQCAATCTTYRSFKNKPL